jgi:hypothetical protein
VIALVAVIDSFTLASNAGAEVSGHRLTHGPLRGDGPRLRSPLSRPRHASSSDAGARTVVSSAGSRRTSNF